MKIQNFGGSPQETLASQAANLYIGMLYVTRSFGGFCLGCQSFSFLG
jgi:hypothetical protein